MYGYRDNSVVRKFKEGGNFLHILTSYTRTVADESHKINLIYKSGGVL